MDLLTLNLHKALAWRAAALPGSASFADILAIMEKAPEGAEAALFWDWSRLVAVSAEDGPRALRPLQPPSRFAELGLPAPASDSRLADAPTGAAASVATVTPAGDTHTGAAASAATDAPAGATAERAADSLQPGRYLFIQARAPRDTEAADMDAWLADSVEWFAREAWWTQAAATGELVVRLVREDGKTAVQLIRRADAPA